MNQPTWDWDSSPEWEELIGKSIRQFAEIEYVSVKCLTLIPTDKISDTASNLRFSDRASILIEILESREDRDLHTASLLDGFKRAKALSTTRNLIAHNPMVMDIYLDENNNTHKVEHKIAKTRGKERSIDLAELRMFAAEVEKVSALLWRSYVELDPESGEVV